jgi:hypothetical protein
MRRVFLYVTCLLLILLAAAGMSYAEGEKPYNLGPADQVLDDKPGNVGLGTRFGVPVPKSMVREEETANKKECPTPEKIQLPSREVIELLTRPGQKKENSER